MCAINGFTFENQDRIRNMNRVTSHRGPDGTGTYVRHSISLGHNRLAIVDLSEAGAQPMESGDGALVISFNGEIYNFKELREELAGYTFRSKTDTEVILAAYERWGVSAFRRLNGMFAFALWDARAQKLFLVRDRAGIKPLYYFHDNSKLIFSSEIKALLEHDIPRVLDRESLAHYLRVLYVPAPRTMFKDIWKLEPGMMLTYAKGAIEITSYLKEEQKATDPVSDEGLHAVVTKAVEHQLVSDRPVGVYLSGGFDSSILLSAATKAGGAIDTFSIGFDLGKDHQRQEFFNADATLARRTAEHFGARHHEVLVGDDEVPELFERMIGSLDEPIANATMLPMLRLAEYAKETVTVALSGDGGDEVFGGYERYRLSLLSSYYRTLPSVLRDAAGRMDATLAKLDTSPGIERYMRFLFQKDAEVARVYGNAGTITEEFFKERFFTPVDSDFERQFMDVDRRSWLVDECLARTDIMSMVSAVEVRVPFLDNEVLAYAARIPTNQKVTVRETKRMLRRAFRAELPDYLYRQPKRGWFSPGGEWVKGGRFGVLVDEMLSPSFNAKTADLFDWSEVKNMLAAHRAGTEYHMVMLWALLVLQGWIKKYDVRI